MLENYAKLCIGTGSQVSSNVIGSDAPKNLKSLFDILTDEKNLQGFYVVFGDVLLSGMDVVKMWDDRINAFNTVNGGPAIFNIGTDIRVGHGYNAASKYKGSAVTRDGLKFVPLPLHEILLIDESIGADKELMINNIKSGRVKGIIWQSQGTGNPNLLDENETDVDEYDKLYAFNDVFELAADSEIPLIVGTKVIHGVSYMTAYDPGNRALELFAVPCTTHPFAVAKAKMAYMLATGKSYARFGQEFCNNMYGEYNTDQFRENKEKVEAAMMLRTKRILKGEHKKPIEQEVQKEATPQATPTESTDYREQYEELAEMFKAISRIQNFARERREIAVDPMSHVTRRRTTIYQLSFNLYI